MVLCMMTMDLSTEEDTGRFCEYITAFVSVFNQSQSESVRDRDKVRTYLGLVWT